MSGPEWIEVGYVAGAHGVRGGVRVVLHDPASRALATEQPLRLLGPDGASRQVRVVEYSEVPGQAGRFRVQLDAIRGRDEALALKGYTITVDRQTLPELEADEFYLADAVGLPVVRTGDEVHLGKVVGLASNGVQDLLEIEWINSRGRPERWLLPAIEGFVLDVDADRIVADPPSGMVPEALESGP